MAPPVAPTQAELYRLGLDWLPRFVANDPDVQEVLWGMAAQWARVGRRVDELYQQGLITRSSGPYLDQHLVDRGAAPRGVNEPIDAARERARTIDEAATPNAILLAARRILQGGGVNAAPALVELRQDKAYARRGAYVRRGYRAGPTRHPSPVIVILPFGTSQALARSVFDGVRLIRSAGYPHRVETRRLP